MAVESKQEFLNVEFKISVQYDQFPVNNTKDYAVYILGNTIQIGEWNIEKAIQMQEKSIKESREMKWIINIEFPLQCPPLEYKYIIKNKITEEVYSWETIPGNRTMSIYKGKNVAINQYSRQSSIYTTSQLPYPGSREPSLGNNGTCKVYDEWQCCRTQSEENPWWEVELDLEYSLSKIYLWKCMTYHHQSTIDPLNSDKLWIIVSKEPLPAEENGLKGVLEKVELAKSLSAPDIIAIHVEMNDNLQVEQVDFSQLLSTNSGFLAKYIRIQYESVNRSLQFAELEAIAATKEASSIEIKQDDGVYGYDTALNSSLEQFVDSGWLNPSMNMTELRLWIGALDEKHSVIEWYDTEAKMMTDSVKAELNYGEHVDEIGSGSGADASSQLRNTIIQSHKCDAILDPDCRVLFNAAEKIKNMSMNQDVNNLNTYLNAYLENYQSRKSSDDIPGSIDHSTGSWLRQLILLNKNVSENDMASLQQLVETQTFNNDQIVYSYGERTPVIIYLKEGKVDITGPRSDSHDSRILGQISHGTTLNEKGFVGQWPKLGQSAEFRANGTVKCELLHFNSLLKILGKEKTQELRCEFIRQLHQNSHLESAAIGQSISHPKQEEYSDSWNSHSGYMLKFRLPSKYFIDNKKPDAKKAPASRHMTLRFYNSKSSTEVGFAPMLSSQLREGPDEGYLKLPIFSTANFSDKTMIIGEITVLYLVIKPFNHNENNLSRVWRSYWRERLPLRVGHRGMGRSFQRIDNIDPATVTENTLQSFILAGKSGAQFVEFDVHLTKDLIPIIYHDLHVDVEVKKHSTFTSSDVESTLANSNSKMRASIIDLTFDQLRAFKTSPLSHGVPTKSSDKESKIKVDTNTSHSNASSKSTANQVENNLSDMNELSEKYPTLQSLLRTLPPEIGLNMEIKFPDLFRSPNRFQFTPSGVNTYIDTILQCLFENAGPTRRVFISCFDPHICILLRAKQTKYPVLLLTIGTTKRLPEKSFLIAADSLQFAYYLTKMEQLQGIVSHCDSLLAEPSLITTLKREQLLVMTYGSNNTVIKNVQLQTQYCIDGIISDNIHTVYPHLQV